MSESESIGKLEMNRYNNSKIYKLRDEISGYYYIGSTRNCLSKRLSQHKCDTKKKPDVGVYKLFNEVGQVTLKIILVEEHYLENKNSFYERKTVLYKCIKPMKNV